MGAEGDGEAGEFGEMIGDNRGGDLVHGQAAVGLGNVDRHEAEVSGFFQEGAGHFEMLGLNFVGRGKDFVADKLGGGARDLTLLFAEVFRGHDVFRGALLDEEAATGNRAVQNFRRCGHCFSLVC